MGSKYIRPSVYNLGYVDPRRPSLGLRPTKYFVSNYKRTIQPGRGLTQTEIHVLPKGITVVQRKEK